LEGVLPCSRFRWGTAVFGLFVCWRKDELCRAQIRSSRSRRSSKEQGFCEQLLRYLQMHRDRGLLFLLPTAQHSQLYSHTHPSKSVACHCLQRFLQVCQQNRKREKTDHSPEIPHEESTLPSPVPSTSLQALQTEAAGVPAAQG
jgi:hypothetical protein